METTKPLLVHKYENVLYGICIITSVIITIYLLLSIIGAIILIFLALISFFSHALSMAHIQVNGVRLRETQFPELYQKVEELSRKMELKKIPEVYVIESGGLLNAFATKVLGLFGKNMVVLYSDFVDLSLESDGYEIDYVIAHELAHIKRNHIVKALLVFPAMWFPFVGAGFSRMAEYTCDRMAAYYTNQPESAINGLLIFAAGRRLYKKVQIEEFQKQYNEKKGVFVTLTELLSTHPPIPKRIQEIETFMYGAPNVPLLKRSKQIVAIMFILFLLLPAITVGLFIAGFKAIEGLDFFNEFLTEGFTPLMEATLNGDIDRVEELLEEGAEPNELNEFGESALLVGVVNEQTDIIPILLEYGADPNLQDDYGWTPLMSAVFTEDTEIGKMLLESGADPMLVDEDDMSAIDYAEEIGNKEYVELLHAYVQEDVPKGRAF